MATNSELAGKSILVELLAVMEAQSKPAGFYTDVSGRKGVVWHNGTPADDTAVFTAPPAPAVPAVPDAITADNAPAIFEIAAQVERIGLSGAYGAYASGWNACRAAIIAAGGKVKS